MENAPITQLRNLYHMNLPIKEGHMKSADFDLRKFYGFYKGAVEYLKDTAMPIFVRRLPGSPLEEYAWFVLDTSHYENQEKEYDEVFREVFDQEVEKVFTQNDSFNSSNAIFIVDRKPEEESFAVHEDPFFMEEGQLTFYLRPNTYQLERIKAAISNLQSSPLSGHKPLYDLFSQPGQAFQSGIDPEPVQEWKILDKEEYEGTSEQREFVQKALSTPDFALLEGPPGSGKTTTIIELVLQLALRGKRVLLVSATHVAVDNVISRIIGTYKDQVRELIVPVRIARRPSDITDEEVKAHRWESLARKYRNEIKEHLSRNNQRGSQQYLQEAINQPENEHLDRIILDSANLVGGTTIGILRHPDFGKYALSQPFDVMIVDEASKVTFGEFLVPALYAKRWILVGDKHQLSPYVEGDFVEDHLRKNGPDEAEQTLLAKTFALRSKMLHDPDTLKVLFTNWVDAGDLKNLLDNSKTYGHPAVLFELKAGFRGSEKEVLALNSADVVIAKPGEQGYRLLARHLYVPAQFFGDIPTKSPWKWRQDAFRKRRWYEFEGSQGEWAELLARKLDQSFGFRDAKDDFGQIEQEVELLIPEEVRDTVARIKRIPFPSILEIIQSGTGRMLNQREGKVLSDGMSDASKASRFVSLSYQHRMHPDIAETSRKHFYEGKNLQASKSVSNRAWSYDQRQDRVRWIANKDPTGYGKGPIENPTELDHVMEELRKFLRFATQGIREKPFELAILTFYRNQEWQLRKRIAQELKQRQQQRTFRTQNLTIRVCTVDRFQGQEADLVMLSFVKATAYAHYNSPNRLNVALTRARHQLILFGHPLKLKKCARLDALKYLATEYKSTMKYSPNKNRRRKKWRKKSS